MESRELRIGNLYQPTDGSAPFAKVEVDDLLAWDRGAIYGKKLPLTEDWLLRLGFKQDIGFLIFSIDQYYIRIRDNFEFGIDEEGGLHLREIQYVHQLQNLYYALAGEELELK